jgi:Family of unknown function (DUF6275)
MVDASPSPLRMKGAPMDLDRFLITAKEVVIENFNDHRNPDRSPALTVDSVHIVWYVKVLGNWKAVIASPLARGLLWEVSFNGQKNEIYIDVYSKLNNTKISLGDKK